MAQDGVNRNTTGEEDGRIAHALTWRYVIALTLVASLATAAWISLHFVISEQESTAAVVNVSGRQRMLSQRTALFSNLLAIAPRDQRAQIRARLTEAIDLMERSHRGLTHGDKDMKLPDTMSPAVRAMYFDGPSPLDGQVRAYIQSVHDLLLISDEKLTPDHPLLQHITSTAPTSLVAALDKMVRQYQQEGETAVKRLEKAETIFWLLTLALLALEAALIFHPFIRHIKTVIGKLKETTDELLLHKEHLEELVRMRTAALEIKSSELAESEEKFRLISTAAQDAIVIMGPNEEVAYWNPAAENIFGYTSDEITHQNLHDILAPAQYAHAAHDGFAHFRHSGTGSFIGNTFEISALKKNGAEFPVELSVSAFKLRNSWHALGIIRDITERRKAETDMRIAATVFESMEGMMVTDANNKILRVNQAFTHITGYSPEEIQGKQPNILNSGRQDADFYATMWKSIHETGAWEGEIWNRRKNGEIYPEYLTITAVKDAQGMVTNYVSTFNDITLSKVAEDEIKNLAFYDPLTRLPNRRLLLDRLRQTLALSARSEHSGALLFIDLDNFKTLNDTLGHDIGDMLLQQVAIRLTACVRKGDTVARLGGDEFVVILEELSKNDLEAGAQAETIGNKILASLNETYQLGSVEHHNTPSIGVTLFNGYQTEIDDLLKQADIAMYQSKSSGRNAIRFFDPAMQAGLNVRIELERELHKALNEQQFQLYFQLQVGSTLQPLGAEALIRWQHPQHGMISPAAFIPLAEETGLILQIGTWVLETACAQIRAWQQEAHTRHLVLAVNVSAKQFRQTSFVEQVIAIIHRHGIDPKRLKLELTESILLENAEKTTEKMCALQAFGVKFSLDDFGTGYSSLQYLRQLPLDQLKVDQSFVRDIGVDRSDAAIVAAIINMAKTLELDVIAEGVETEEQHQLLLDKGCTNFQGYLFSKPLPIEQFDELIRQG